MDLLDSFVQNSRSRSSSFWSNLRKFDSFSRSHCDTRDSEFDSFELRFFSAWMPKVLISRFILLFSSIECRQSLWLMYLVESWSEGTAWDTRNEELRTWEADLVWDTFVVSHLSCLYFSMSVIFARSSSLWSKYRRKARRIRGVNLRKFSGIFVVSRF